MDGVKLTDKQVAALAHGTAGVLDTTDQRVIMDGDAFPGAEEAYPYIQALACEVQDFRALRSVMDMTLRDVSARLITPYDALARIVMELASLDSVGTTDGR